MNVLSTIFAPIVAIGIAIGSFFAPAPEPQLGASQAVPTTVAFFETTLASPITSTSTTFTLSSATDKDGNALASSTYGFVIDEGSSNVEVVLADCTGTSCTNALRGVSVTSGNASVAALKKAHRRGASVKITDAPILVLTSRALRGEDVTNFTPIGNGSLVDKQYVDGVALGAGAVPSTYTDDGILELATGVQAASSTATDNSGSPLTLHTSISTSTAPVSGNYVVVTQTNGNIADGFIDSSVWSLLGSSTKVELFTASSTWTKPTGADLVEVILIGGGGGGGGGKGNDGSNPYASGGAGGGGGGCSRYVFSASSLSSPVDVWIGHGGTGGLGGASETPGTSGSSTQFGIYLKAGGGTFGGVGVVNAGVATAGVGGSGLTEDGGGTNANTKVCAGTGGGSGGGGGGNNGGTGGGKTLQVLVGGTGGTSGNYNGLTGNSMSTTTQAIGGTGGGGGYGSDNIQAGNGAAGALYGGGGGGGGSTFDPSEGGNGGNGANGAALIISYF